jgi:hypothetical protein
MSYDNDFNTDPDGEVEHRQNVIRPPKMPGELKEAIDRMMVI